MKEFFGDTVWCQLAEQKLIQGKLNIITDVRLPLEHNYFKSRYKNCISIRIKRDSILSPDSHITETASDNIVTDYILENNTDALDKYKEIVKEFYHNNILGNSILNSSLDTSPCSPYIFLEPGL